MTVEPLTPSAALTTFAYSGTNNAVTNSDTTPSGFTVTGGLVAGATVGISAAKTGTDDKVEITKTVSSPTAETSLSFDFDGGDVCDIRDDATTNDDSCTLGEGEWTFSAFQKEASKARFVHADTFTITVDTTNPVIVTTIDPDPTTMPAATMRTVTATVTDANPDRLAYATRPDGTACPTTLANAASVTNYDSSTPPAFTTESRQRQPRLLLRS